MRFPDFYGNPLLKQRVSAAFGRGQAGHCYILCGPSGSGKHTLVRLLAAALQCTGDGDRPCGRCPDCNKSLRGLHPDIITIDSDKATVPVELIRNMRSDAFIRPNEGARKIYIIPRAQDMQDTAQNALLKILEEPPAYCSFFLLTDSPDKLLTTVRSRAVELTLSPLPDSELHAVLRSLRPDAEEAALIYACEQSEGYIGPALALLDSGDLQQDPRLTTLAKAMAASDDLAILELLAPMEKQDRQSVTAFVTAVYQLLIRTLRYQQDPGSAATAEVRTLSVLSQEQISAWVGDLAHILSILQANGNTGGCVGLLLADLTS